jgi:hypothetical protein
MKDPLRLLDEGATTAELSLLRAGMTEEPSEQSVQRLASLLGLAGGAAVLTAATKSSAAGAVASGAASKMAAKWLVLGALGVAGGAAIVFAGSAAAHRAPPPARGSSGALRVDERGLPGVVAPVPNGLTGEGVVLPVTEATRGAASAEPAAPLPRSPAAEGAGRASSPSIAREIAALDVARRLLGSGNPRGALGALDDYEAQAKTGMLRQEATLLRIEALAVAGDASAARRLAHRFLQNHPHSPHENRVRALVGESP